jgi:hypothetical protein
VSQHKKNCTGLLEKRSGRRDLILDGPKTGHFGDGPQKYGRARANVTTSTRKQPRNAGKKYFPKSLDPMIRNQHLFSVKTFEMFTAQLRKQSAGPHF